MTSDEPMSAQDQERQSRALGALMGNLEKASEASSEMDKTKPSGSEREDAHAKAEAERMRREIAARLERLSEQWKATLKPSE